MVKERTLVKARPVITRVKAPPQGSDRLGIILVVLSAIGFGTLGIFGKLAYGDNLTVLGSLSWRLGGGAGVLWLWLLSSQQWRIPRRSAIAAFGLGAIIYSIQAGLFFSALTYATAGVTALMFYTYPAFVAIGHWLTTRTALHRWHMVALGLTFCGCLMTIDWQQEQIHPIGIVLGLGSGAAYGIYMILGARLLQKTPPVPTAGYMLAGAATAIVSTAIWQQQLIVPRNLTQVGIASGLAIVATALPIVLLFTGLKRLDVVPAAILSTIEPIAAVFLGMIFLQEPLWPGQIIGGTLILLGALLLQIKIKR